MKKVFCFLVCLIMIGSSAFLIVYANDISYAEAKYRIYEKHVYYIRFDQNVVGTGERFRVEYTPKDQNTVSVLDQSCCSIFSGDRMEVIMQFPDHISEFTLFDLVLQDGTSVQQNMKTDSGFSSAGDMSDVWALKKHDAFYAYPLIGKDQEICFVTVGSEWEFRFKEYTSPRDPYLRKHITLEADGIELKKDGEKYVFQSLGDGEVSLCMFGVPCMTVKTHVMEKSAIRQKMLLTVPIESVAVAIYSVHWLGPLALVVALPLAGAYTIFTFFYMLFA